MTRAPSPAARPRRGGARLLAFLAPVLALVVLACGGEGNARVVAEGGGEITLGDSPTAATGADAAPADSTAEPAAPEVGEATATPEPTSTPEAEDGTPRWGILGAPRPGVQEGSDDPATAEGDLSGSPHSTADVRAAVEAAGYLFRRVTDQVGVLCPNTSVPGAAVWTASSASDLGPVFTLWVYPNTAAMQADWSTSSGRVQPRTSGCSLPSGHVYWNGNAVLAFHTWIEAGTDIGLGGYSGSPREYGAVEAFLGMPR